MWSIIGHAPALAVLDRALGSLRPAHAWLFSGPEGLGKQAVALEFAAALNCRETAKPCGDCRSCRDTLAGRHPDVELVAPGGLCDEPDHADHSESRDLRICQVRRLERILSLAPYAGGRRVAIIDAADTLRAEAANAFLKTLEEPPSGCVIILLVEREERLPETVLSRCQKVRFHPLRRQVIEEALQGRGADPAQARAIAAAAGGRIGWALRALQQPALLEERASMLETARRLAGAGLIERFDWARGAESRSPETRERFLRELRVWEEWWRDVLAASAGCEEGLLSGSASLPAQDGRMYQTGEVVAFLRTLLQTREHLQANVDPQLALENLTLELPRPRRPAR